MSEVVVKFEDEPNPKKLTAVSLSVKAKEEPGQVLALSFDQKDDYWRATVFGQSKKVSVWTKSPRMKGVMETAMRQSIPVNEFDLDRERWRSLAGRST